MREVVSLASSVRPPPHLGFFDDESCGIPLGGRCGLRGRHRRGYSAEKRPESIFRRHAEEEGGEEEKIEAIAMAPAICSHPN